MKKILLVSSIIVIVLLLLPFLHLQDRAQVIENSTTSEQLASLSSILSYLEYVIDLLDDYLALRIQKAKAQTEVLSLIRQDCTGYTNCYNSLNAWESARNRDLVYDDEIEIVRIEGTWTSPDTRSVIINGWTTDAEHYIRIYTTPEARHDGKWNNMRYRMNGSVFQNIEIIENYVEIEGLQFTTTNTNNPTSAIIIDSSVSGNIKISHSISTGNSRFFLGAGGGIVQLWNNLVYGGATTGFLMRGTATYYVYSNTVARSNIGYRTMNTAIAYIKNSIGYSNSNGDFNQYAGTLNCNYCASSDSTADNFGGTGNKVNQIFTFVDATNNDFHLTASDASAKDFGVDLSSDIYLAFNNDIDFETRSGTWDIGADEFSGAIPPIYQCSDSTDNDGDGLIDYPNDPGCDSTTDNDEYNTPPTDTTPPSTPANLSAQAISSSQINLTWTASTDNVGVTGYRVERCQGTGCTNFTQIATPTTNSYNNTSLSASTNYSYRVRATDAAGNLSSYSNTSSATTQAVSPPTPGQPSIIGVSSANITHRQNLTISGSNFGTKNPAAPLMWDDGESKNVNLPSALISEGGWTDREGREMWARTGGGTETTYNDIQYRSANFRNMPTPHIRSTKYIAGSHNNYRKITDTAYRWVRSSVGTNEYYLESSSGGQPDLGGKTCCGGEGQLGWLKIGESGNYTVQGVIGSLNNRQWGWGNNDALSFNTIYFRDDLGNPDVSGVILWIGLVGQTALSEGANVGIMKNFGFNYRQLFLSYYMAYDPLWPRDGTGNGNNKIINFETTNSIYSTIDYLQHSHGTLPQIGRTFVGDSPIGTDSDICYATGGPGCYPNPINNWQRWTYILDFDSFIYKYVYANNQRITAVSHTGQWETATRSGITLGGYFCYSQAGAAGHDCINNNQKDGHQHSFRYFDDIYIDTTLSRVVLADNSNYDQATIIEPQIPSAWADGSITTAVNLGKLPDSGTAYLFVFDSNNNRNSVGYPVTLGTGTPPPTDTTPPSTPANLSAQAISSSQINLTWTASTDNVGVTGYRIYRCTGSGCTSASMIEIGTSVTNSYSDSGLNASTYYNYAIAAYDASGNGSVASISASATTFTPSVSPPSGGGGGSGGSGGSGSYLPIDTSAPSVPTSLIATTVSSSQINLTWTASTDNVGVTGYRIYRCTGSGCTSASMIEIGTSVTNSYSDSGINTFNTYRYSVAAYDSAGNGSYTSAAVTTTFPTASSTPVSTSTGTKYNFIINLTVGSKNLEVSNLQTVLKLEGLFTYPSITGYFGNVTKQAVIGFQKKYNITPAAGYVGPITRNKLNQLYGDITTAPATTINQTLIGPFSIGMRSEQVKILQQMLAKDKTIYPEGIISGYYGTLTVSAVQRFQCRYMYICSGDPSSNGYGLAGPNTRKKISEILGK